MNTDKRTIFLCSATVPTNQYEDIKTFLGCELSKVFGGATIYKGNGFWSENGEDNLERYSDNIEQRTVLITHLSVITDLEERALQTLKSTFKKINEAFNLNNTHIHVEKISSLARHISI